MRELSIHIHTTHDENSDTHLAALLAKFTSDLHGVGYSVSNIECQDAPYVLLEEPQKSVAQMTPIPPRYRETPDYPPETADVPEDQEEVEVQAEAEVAVEPGVEEEAALAPVQGPKTKPLIDPSDFSIKELRSGVLDGYIRRQLISLSKREVKGLARVGALGAINLAMDEL